MSDKESAQSVIEAYRKRQQRSQKAPIIITIIMAVLVIIGAALIIFWLVGGGLPSMEMFKPSETPTNTLTPTATDTLTPTPSETPTETPTLLPTNTFTPTVTETAASAFIYVVNTGDTLLGISEQFDVTDPCLIIEMNSDKLDIENPIIYAGQELLIPPPGLQRPTATELPAGYRTVILYTILPGEGLFQVAVKFNSTLDAIREENDFTEDDIPSACQVIKVPPNLVTPVPTWTEEVGGGSTPGSIMTLTPTSEAGEATLTPTLELGSVMTLTPTP